MIKQSAKFGLLFFSLFAIFKWIFGSEISWLEVIGISFFTTLFYLLFEWVERKHEKN